MFDFIAIRGLPGSGKNWYIENRLVKEIQGACIICSADDFFIQNGVWRFNPADLGKAHSWCFNKAIRAMMDHTIPTIILNNTNTQLWEYQNYLLLAKKFGYNVHVLEMFHTPETARKFFNRQTHGVPEAIYAQMLFRWENDPMAELIYPND